MKFFDYIFYRVCRAYLRASENGAEGSAFAVVSLVQTFNIISIIMLIGMIIHKKSVLNKGVGLFILFSLYLINYIRYIYKSNNNYQILKTRWENEKFQFRNGMLALTYLIVSIFSCLFFAAYLGTRNW